MAELHRFAVVDGSDIEQLVLGLELRLGLRREPPQHVTRRMLDTFDWRVFADGSLLEYRSRPGSPDELVWRSLGSGKIHGRLDTERPPRFAWDLPAGPLRGRLEAIVEMRAMSELVSVESIQTVLRLVDADGKTTGRVVVDRSRLNWQDLPAVVEVVPMRGYPREAETLTELLSAQVVLREGADDPLHTALALTGLEAGSYTSKLKLKLDPDATAAAAWMEVLRTLHHTMAVNTVGVHDDTDSEFLHDYRVAVRRTRSVLSQAKGILPPEVLARFRDEFAHLGRVTGPTRDLDVYRLTLPEFEHALAPERRSHLEPFAKYLDRRQREAQETLVGELDSIRVLEALEDWGEWLDASVVDEADAPLAGMRADDVAAERIWRVYRRLVRDGRMITNNSPGEDLHQLRKDAKRLRYMLECFGSLYPQSEVAMIVKELKGLQDVLGEFQDCEVQAASIGGFADDIFGQHGASAATLLAMGSIVEVLDERRQVARDTFASRFARFDAKIVRATVGELFKPKSQRRSVDDEPVTATDQPPKSGTAESGTAESGTAESGTAESATADGAASGDIGDAGVRDGDVRTQIVGSSGSDSGEAPG